MRHEELSIGELTVDKILAGDNGIQIGGVLASHVVVAAGEFTTLGGDAAERIVLADVVATDLCHVSLHTKGASPVTILTAVCGAGDIDVVMSADPSTDHVLTYSVLRATS